MKPFARVLDWWFEPVHPVRLRTFEKAFALSFVLYMSAWLHGAAEWLTTSGFHYPLDISDRAFSMPLPPLPPSLLWPFVFVLIGAPMLVVIGRFRRPALFLSLLCAFYVQRVDTYSAFTINKLFIVGFLVLFLAPAAVGRGGGDYATRDQRISPREWLVAVIVGGGYTAWAMPEGKLNDNATIWLLFSAFIAGVVTLMALSWRRRPASDGGPDLRQSAWPVRVLQATLIIQYGTAGICKMAHGDWLDRTDILIGHSVGLYRTEVATWLIDILPHWAWVVQGVLALGFEIGAPILFIFKRLRPLAYMLGVGMHIVIAVMMVDLIWFSLQMVTFYILFVDGERLERFDGWLQSKATSKG